MSRVPVKNSSNRWQSNIIYLKFWLCYTVVHIHLKLKMVRFGGPLHATLAKGGEIWSVGELANQQRRLIEWCRKSAGLATP